MKRPQPGDCDSTFKMAVTSVYQVVGGIHPIGGYQLKDGQQDGGALRHHLVAHP